MPGWADVRALVRDVERLLLPGACLLCLGGLGADWEGLVCARCRSRWRTVPPPWCARCGQPMLPDLGCRFCAEWPEALGVVRSAVWLEGAAREAVHALKYGGWHGVARALAQRMRGLEPLEAGAALVPIPLGRRRRRRRGYNQAEALARALGAVTGLAVRTDVLVRRRDTRTQTALAPSERAANVHDAFMATGGRGARLVIVDDVCTTGATLAAAAVALRAAGAARVDAVTFARAPLPVPDGT